MTATTVYLGPEDKGISLDSVLGTVGDRGTVTIDSEQCAVIYGFGTTYLFVERGDAGTTRAAHVIGTTVTATISSLGVTPTLAEVLTTGNDPETTKIEGATVGATAGAQVWPQPGDGEYAGTVLLAGGNAAGANKFAGDIYIQGGVGSGGADGGALIANLKGETGIAGQALVSFTSADMSQKVAWGGIASGNGAPANAAAFSGFLPLYRNTANDDLYILVGSTVVGPYNLGT